MRPAKLSPELRSLLGRCPLPRRQDGDRILRGDLESGVDRYRELGVAGKSSDEWWTVFFALEGELGRGFEQSVLTLDTPARLSVARWAFEQGRVDVGLLAYRSFLEDGAAKPEVADALRYIDHAATSLGPIEGARAADAVLAKLDSPEIRLCSVEHWLAAGNPNEAKLRIAGRGAAAEDWAILAIVEARLGNPPGVQRALENAAKRRFVSPIIERAMLDATKTNDAGWARLKAASAALPRSPSASGGARPAPAPVPAVRRGALLFPANDRTPHSFGGFDLFMPPCAACGQPIRQWFLVSVEEDFELGRVLKQIRELPLMSCGACDAWRFRHDYAVDADGTTLTLLAVHADAAALARAASSLRPIPSIARQNAMLINRASLSSEPPYSTFVGGDPPWLGVPLDINCPRCQRSMLFVAALGQVSQFKPPMSFNGGVGYQLHFACDPCRTLSVIPEAPR
ncbi:MAG: hypothetical protein U0271_00730 [Polyangiaceae bacterium]